MYCLSLSCIFFSLFVNCRQQAYTQMTLGLNTDNLKRMIASMADDTGKIGNFIIPGQQS